MFGIYIEEVRRITGGEWTVIKTHPIPSGQDPQTKAKELIDELDVDAQNAGHFLKVDGAGESSVIYCSYDGYDRGVRGRWTLRMNPRT